MTFSNGEHTEGGASAGAGGKTVQEEYLGVRAFYERLLRLARNLRDVGMKAKKKQVLYSVTFTYPPWADRRTLYAQVHEFARRVVRNGKDAVWLVADTRPCSEAECERLFNRLRREGDPPFGFHWHGIVLTSRTAERVRQLWVNYGNGEVKAVWVKAIQGRPGRWEFDNGLSRVVHYHVKPAPHLDLGLESRVVARGVLERLWRKATGWRSANPNLEPFARFPPCGDPVLLEREPRTRVNGEQVMRPEPHESGRTCRCGCGESIAHLSSHAKYLTATHRMRAARRAKAGVAAMQKPEAEEGAPRSEQKEPES